MFLTRIFSLKLPDLSTYCFPSVLDMRDWEASQDIDHRHPLAWKRFHCIETIYNRRLP